MSEPLSVDPSDFDAVGVLSDAVVNLRAHVMAADADTAATLSAPPGWHHVVVTAKPGGSTVLVVRYGDLTVSRLRNVADALSRRGWQLDEDGEGATLRQAPGTARHRGGLRGPGRHGGGRSTVHPPPGRGRRRRRHPRRPAPTGLSTLGAEP